MPSIFPRTTASLVPLVFFAFMLAFLGWHQSDLEASSLGTSCVDHPRDGLAQQTDPSSQQHFQPKLSTRELIEQATMNGREKTAFPKVVVLNLKSRQDRRDHMRALAEVQDLDITFIEATPFMSPEVIWIHERLYDDANNITWTHGKDATDDWRMHYLETPTSRLLPPPSAKLPPHVEALKDFPVFTEGVHSLPGPIACYVTHLTMLRRMVDEKWGPTIVFEDDIDLEWNFRQRWTEVMDRSMPKEKDWQLVYLGYSYSTELAYEPMHSPLLRPAIAPLATYAYALSPSGARNLLYHLINYIPLFSKPIDHMYVAFAFEDSWEHREEPEKKTVFSFVPAIVGHGGSVSMGSDIGGTSNAWGTLLSDSTLARLQGYRQSLVQAAGGETVQKQIQAAA